MEDVGKFKTLVAKEKLLKTNPNCNITEYSQHLIKDNLNNINYAKVSLLVLILKNDASLHIHAYKTFHTKSTSSSYPWPRAVVALGVFAVFTVYAVVVGVHGCRPPTMVPYRDILY